MGLFLQNPNGELNSAGAEEELEWRAFVSVVDSGAAESVAPEKDLPHIATVPSPGSRAGVTYTAANGESIENEGQKEVTMITNEGQNVNVLYQVADVSRTLTSVSRVCDAGNRVIFESWGGYIQNLQTGSTTTFERKSNVYELTGWMLAPKPNTPSRAEGFPWQSKK